MKSQSTNEVSAVEARKVNNYGNFSKLNKFI